MLPFGDVCLRVKASASHAAARARKIASSPPANMNLCRRNLLATFVLIAILIALGQTFAWAEQPPLVAVGTVETRLLADAADGKLDNQPFLRAALICGGAVTQPELSHLQQQLDSLCQPLDNRRLNGERLTVEILFDFLHSTLLTGEYNAAVTTLSATIDTGSYNCLTATALLLALGDRYAVPLSAVSTSGHIYCRSLGGELRDIETTCAAWLSASTGESHRSHTGRWASVRPINRVQLLGKFYYNRGVALLADRQYAAAIPLLEISRQLDPHDSDARENLLAGLNNWALACAEAEQFEEAARLVLRGQAIHPTYGPLVANDLHIHQRWASILCMRRDYAGALAVLDQVGVRHPSADLAVAGPRAVYAEWIDWHLQRGEHQQAREVVATARLHLNHSVVAKLESRLGLATRAPHAAAAN
jgi:tetratricopeptide (TPR) repeat protein